MPEHDWRDQRTAWVIVEGTDGDHYIYQEKTVGVTHKGAWIVSLTSRPVAAVSDSAMAMAIIEGKDLEPDTYVLIITCGKQKGAKCRIERAKQPVAV